MTRRLPALLAALLLSLLPAMAEEAAPLTEQDFYGRWTALYRIRGGLCTPFTDEGWGTDILITAVGAWTALDTEPAPIGSLNGMTLNIGESTMTLLSPELMLFTNPVGTEYVLQYAGPVNPFAGTWDVIVYSLDGVVVDAGVLPDRSRIVIGAESYALSVPGVMALADSCTVDDRTLLLLDGEEVIAAATCTPGGLMTLTFSGPDMTCLLFRTPDEGCDMP